MAQVRGWFTVRCAQAIRNPYGALRKIRESVHGWPGLKKSGISWSYGTLGKIRSGIPGYIGKNRLQKTAERQGVGISMGASPKQAASERTRCYRDSVCLRGRRAWSGPWRAACRWIFPYSQSRIWHDGSGPGAGGRMGAQCFGYAVLPHGILRKGWYIKA